MDENMKRVQEILIKRYNEAKDFCDNYNYSEYPVYLISCVSGNMKMIDDIYHDIFGEYIG